LTLSLYSVHATDTPGEYIIQKFDPDYRCESVYALSEVTCMCPQGHKPTCRHRKMLAEFLRLEHIGDGWFMEWDTRLWRRPVGDMEPTLTGLQEEQILMGFHQPKLATTEEPVSHPSDRAASDEPLPAACGETSATPVALAPPPPPEGHHSTQAAGAAPVSPVGTGAIVKRRRIP
jgi:hypothetical protein